MSSTIERITATTEYHTLLQKRHRLIWPLAIITFVSYFAFILAIAFKPQALAMRMGDGVVSYGIVLGVVLILLNFVITLLYVRGANTTIEPLLKQIHAAVGEK